MRAIFDDHVATADITYFITDFILDLNLFQFLLCRVYIPDVAAWDTVNAVYAAFFGSHKPARVIVPTRELHHGARIEIEAIAEVR